MQPGTGFDRAADPRNVCVAMPVVMLYGLPLWALTIVLSCQPSDEEAAGLQGRCSGRREEERRQRSRRSENTQQYTPCHGFDGSCFTLPAVGYLGNLPRNYLAGPNLVDVDASVLKTTRITEGVTIQFRAEVFNLIQQAERRFAG